MKKICKNCSWRDATGHCNNTDKIFESDYYSLEKDKSKDDYLEYSFDESGGFYVGENFGCIHFKNKEK